MSLLLRSHAAAISAIPVTGSHATMLPQICNIQRGSSGTDLCSREKDLKMHDRHTLEFSGEAPLKFMRPEKASDAGSLNTFELALLGGILVHPDACVTTDTEIPYLCVEWVQTFPI
jgi:hypothetical protein